MTAPPPVVRVVPTELLMALRASAVKVEPAGPATPAAASGERVASRPNFKSRLAVERWLRDRGIEHRVKPAADGVGRAVYVLKHCPFDPDHADPDACVMQAADGRMSAQCFHASCHGKGWQAFKEALGAPGGEHYDPPLRGKSARRRPARGPAADAAASTSAAAAGPPPEPGVDDADGPAEPARRRIVGDGRQLYEVVADALDALQAANDPPTLFRRGAVLTRLRVDPTTDAPTLEVLSEHGLRGQVARSADWFRSSGDGEEPAPPPMDVIKDLMALPDWPGLPNLAGVVESPVFDAGGRLTVRPGYQPDSMLYYHPAAGLVVPEVPEHPTDAQVAAARSVLLDDLLGDFPFVDDSSRAHALCVLLLPFVRACIAGPTPLHLVSAPTPGTGKSLLIETLTGVASARPVEVMTEVGDGDESRKRITSLLLEGAPFALLDNVNRKLDDSALAGVLTCTVWRDRILGSTKTVSVRNDCVWLATANNPRLSAEMIRRTVPVRLDRRTDAPEKVQGFRHPNLGRWAAANRGLLVHAALVVCRAWIDRGRPEGSAVLGRFEGWAGAMSGLLDVAGVPGFLGGRDAFRLDASDADDEWRAFVEHWWAKHAGAAVGVSNLFDLCQSQQLLETLFSDGDAKERAQRTRLGVALRARTDGVVAARRIVRVGVDHSGRGIYRLEPIGREPGDDSGLEDGEIPN